MKPAIVLDANEVRKILADHFSVPIENVQKMQYSYVILQDENAHKDAE